MYLHFQVFQLPLHNLYMGIYIYTYICIYVYVLLLIQVSLLKVVTQKTKGIVPNETIKYILTV